MLKKQFESYWMPERIKPTALRVRDSDFFDKTFSGAGKDRKVDCFAIIPEALRYVDLLGFVGKKTRITIEEIE